MSLQNDNIIFVILCGRGEYIALWFLVLLFEGVVK